MKKLIVIFLILALVCSGAVGCGAKDKLEDKAAEKLMEKMLEQSGVEDVDINEDQITIKGEDGEAVTFGGGEWPNSDLGKSIPEFEKGKLAGTMVTSNYLLINFEEVNRSDAVAYIEENKHDFTVDNFESSSEGMISWSGANEEGLKLTLTLSDASFSIMLLLDESE